MKKTILFLFTVIFGFIVSCSNNSNINDNLERYDSFMLYENFEGNFKNSYKLINAYVEDVPCKNIGCSTYIDKDILFMTFKNDYCDISFEIENIDGMIIIQKSTISENANEYCHNLFIKDALYKQVSSDEIEITIYFVN